MQCDVRSYEIYKIIDIHNTIPYFQLFANLPFFPMLN